jgi:ribosome-binding factor A
MTRRTERLGELFREEISAVIANGLKDPRVGMATISRVEVTEDLSYAKISTSVLGTEKEKADTIIGLNRSAGFIRGVLFKTNKMRHMPQLQFVLDEGIDHSLRVQKILHEISVADQSAKKAQGDSSEQASEGSKGDKR